MRCPPAAPCSCCESSDQRAREPQPAPCFTHNVHMQVTACGMSCWRRGRPRRWRARRRARKTWRAPRPTCAPPCSASARRVRLLPRHALAYPGVLGDQGLAHRGRHARGRALRLPASFGAEGCSRKLRARMHPARTRSPGALCDSSAPRQTSAALRTPCIASSEAFANKAAADAVAQAMQWQS